VALLLIWYTSGLAFSVKFILPVIMCGVAAVFSLLGLGIAGTAVYKV
jgi:hypothetical protein